MPAVAISWYPVSDATHYLIYAGTTNGGPYTYDGSGVGCDTSPKNVGNVSFASFTVPDTGTYYFVVKACNCGDGLHGPSYLGAASSQTQYPLATGATPPVGTPVLSVR